MFIKVCKKKVFNKSIIDSQTNQFVSLPALNFIKD